ncbi:MAG: CDP-alcohol phosphatidyltransferase family protein [bacterium]
MQANSGRIFTVSNFLSFARVLLVWPIVMSLLERTGAGNVKALLFMLVAVITDYLDGYFARKFDQRSDVGRIIDPLADKIGIAIVAIAMTVTHELPVWFLILIITRDLAILLLGAFMVSRTKSIPESNWTGKVTVTAVAVVIIAFTLSIDTVKWYLLYACFAVLVISMYSYLKRFIGAMF